MKPLSLMLLLGVVGAVGTLQASICGIGDWGKTGIVAWGYGCSNTIAAFTCGGELGNEVVITQIIYEHQVEGCYLT